MAEDKATQAQANGDGHFKRKDSAFRDHISNSPNSRFPAEKGRYALYMNYGCPWAHRASLVRALKGLENVIEMIPTDIDPTKDGWAFTGRNGSLEKDPLYGFQYLKQLYFKADPDYVGRYTVPCLWDKKNETIVNNESSEIIRMFYTEFDDFIPPEDREVNKEGGGFYPEHLRKEIDEMNDWVYNTVNNGVYKCGFARSQAAYDENIYPLFKSLDRLEAHLGDSTACKGGPYLFGSQITEADVRLYTTLIRFDSAYHTIFQCNLKTIRHDYPNLNNWLKLLYWDETPTTRNGAFKSTTNFEAYRYGYTRAKARMQAQANETTTEDNNNKTPLIVPKGPAVDIEPMSDDISQTAAPRNNTGNVDAVSEAIKQAKLGDDARIEAHKEENRKWEKLAKKVEKKSGMPNVHLASS